MQELQYLRPYSIKEAVELLDGYCSNLKILAGGTDLIIALKDRMITTKYLMDIKAINELKAISYSETEGLSIGAAVSLNEIIESKLVNDNYPILIEAAKTLANSLLRNRATLVGNICNASPGGDMLGPSIVLEGVAEIASKSGLRLVPLKEFFLGVKKTVVQQNELVTRIIYPNLEGKGKYRRKSRIKGHDLAQINVSIFMKADKGLNICIGAAGPTPVIINGFEEFKAEDINTNTEVIVNNVMSSIKPISDQRASKEFRSAMTKYLTEQILEQLKVGE